MHYPAKISRKKNDKLMTTEGIGEAYMCVLRSVRSFSEKNPFILLENMVMKKIQALALAMCEIICVGFSQTPGKN